MVIQTGDKQPFKTKKIVPGGDLYNVMRGESILCGFAFSRAGACFGVCLGFGVLFSGILAVGVICLTGG